MSTTTLSTNVDTPRADPETHFFRLHQLFGALRDATVGLEELGQETRVDDRSIEALTDEEHRAISRACMLISPLLRDYHAIRDSWNRDRTSPWTNAAEEMEARAFGLTSVYAALRFVLSDPLVSEVWSSDEDELSPFTPGWMLHVAVREVQDAYRRSLELRGEVEAERAQEVSKLDTSDDGGEVPHQETGTRQLSKVDSREGTGTVAPTGEDLPDALEQYRVFAGEMEETLEGALDHLRRQRRIFG